MRRPRAAAETDRAGRLEILLRSRRPDDFERKFKDPNGIIFDVNWKGWTMTSGKVRAKRAPAAAATKTKVRKRTGRPKKAAKPARKK